MATKAATPSHMLHSAHSKLRTSARHLKDERYGKSRTSFEVDDQQEYDEVINLTTWETVEGMHKQNPPDTLKLPAIARVVHNEQQKFSSPRLPLLNSYMPGREATTPIPEIHVSNTPRAVNPYKSLVRKEAMLEPPNIEVEAPDYYSDSDSESYSTSAEGDSQRHGSPQFGDTFTYQDDFEGFIDCETHSTAKQILNIYSVQAEYLNPEFDGCFCSNCSESNTPSTRRIIDEYGVPHGWCKFGLRPPPLVHEMSQIYTEWPVAFFVIRSKNLNPYLETGDLFFDLKTGRTPRQQGDQDNFWLDHLAGKTNTGNKSSPQIKLSPIIDTAEKFPSSPLAEFVTLDDGSKRDVRFALQVRVRPKSYEESNVTSKHIQKRKGPIWKANTMGSIILEAILVRVGDAENSTVSRLPNV